MYINKLIKPNVYSLSAYEAKEIPCKIKLDANESPYGLSDKALSDLRSLKSQRLFTTLNKYPDPQANNLKKKASKYFGVRLEKILHGNGSDELIYYLITTFGGPVLYPVPTFSMYVIITQALGEEKIEIKLDERFDLNLEKILEAIKKEKPKLIFLSSPNNPTGNCFSTDKILRIIEITSEKSIVLVDEAYQPFASEKGFLPMLDDYKNLVILRTLSKVGLAGLRVGFLIADENIINQVNKVRLPFNINSLSQAIAAIALNDKRALKARIKYIVSERERLYEDMSKIRGIMPYPSEANFILFRVKDSDKAYNELLKRGILVRNMKGVVNGCLRVTVGTPEENRIFIDALKGIINKM
ncbi:MAG: histidinol-phosphate transaminase [Nitrospirae bacterium]|jgi:histidinol-phosphate aminotransferase|nr:histidinol-phosphate transaminase [Nitrospirota bacterium]